MSTPLIRRREDTEDPALNMRKIAAIVLFFGICAHSSGSAAAPSLTVDQMVEIGIRYDQYASNCPAILSGGNAGNKTVTISILQYNPSRGAWEPDSHTTVRIGSRHAPPSKASTVVLAPGSLESPRYFDARVYGPPRSVVAVLTSVGEQAYFHALGPSFPVRQCPRD